MTSLPRANLRLYFDQAIFNFKTLADFITDLNIYNACMREAGAALPDSIRIWHCLNCLQDANTEWPTKLLQLDGKFAKLGYWERFTDWDKFSGQLLRKTGNKRLDSDQQWTLILENRRNPHTGSDNDDALSYSYASTSDFYGDDRYYPQDKHNVEDTARATKPNAPIKPAAKDKHAPKADDSARAATVADADANQPVGDDSLNNFADYQDHGDDVQASADKDEKHVIINGERRIVISKKKNSARRRKQGFLIDENFRRIQRCFSRHFPGRPKCLDCKLIHPVKAYAFCRYCYLCHMGGEEECYHLHPELRGTRPEKGKYRHIDNSGLNYERYVRNGVDASTVEIQHLLDFGYNPQTAITRDVVREEREYIRMQPAEGKPLAVQYLLEMVAEDRADRLAAQHAKLVSDEMAHQSLLRLKAKDAAAEAEGERERAEEERLERERRQPKSTRSNKSGTPHTAGLPSKEQTPAGTSNPLLFPRIPFGPDADEAMIERLTDAFNEVRLNPDEVYLTEALAARLMELSIPDPAVYPPPSPAPSSLGAGLAIPQTPQKPQKPQNDAAQQREARPAKTAQTAEMPAFMKNRRRWDSMSSLSTSSSEESIQQFNREHAERKKKNKTRGKNKGKGKAQAAPGEAQANVNPRFNGPRMPAPNREAGGAAL